MPFRPDDKKHMSFADTREEAWVKAHEYADIIVALGLQEEWRAGVEPNPAGGFAVYIRKVDVTVEEDDEGKT
jgi:hypothetical protein